MSGHGYAVEDSRVSYRGRIIRVRSDTVRMPQGALAARDVVEHPGAVGVVVLDPADRVLLVSQYRHPVRRRLWELPAGLLDVEGEPAFDAARRELAEEAGLAAGRWQVLADLLTSPGMSDEAVRVYLAEEPVAVARPAGCDDEELELQLSWVPLADAVARVLAGEIENGLACAGLLAAAAWRSGAVAALRPVDAPWPSRPARGGGVG